MKVLMVASEATPYSKTGGLADVIGSLPAALAAQGEEVAVILPFYRETAAFLPQAGHAYDHLQLWLGSNSWTVNIRSFDDQGVRFFFVENAPLYDRAELYTESGEDYPDNPVRFAVLCHASLAVVRSLFRPDIIQYHDWQACLLPSILKDTLRLDPTFYGIKLLLTIHNLGYQGLFAREVLGDLGLSRLLFHPEALEFHGGISFLKGGIVFADAINTVSPTYAREIQTSELGFGLEDLLRARSAKISGILNGVDYQEWSPDTDKYIAAPYSRENLCGKRLCKRSLLAELGLPADCAARPLIGMVSRFVDQKGFDLIEEIAVELIKEDICLVVLGSGESRYQQMFLDLAGAHPDRVAVTIGYSNELAHKIEAGADIFLMPSRYEPCGLNQIYSLRYGTIPVVRATGGLDDTIDEETGFRFQAYSGAELLRTLRRALAAWRDKARWTAMMQAAMSKDFSWSASAAEYRRLYRRLALNPEEYIDHQLDNGEV